MEKMKEMVGVALFTFVVAAIVMWSCNSTPLIQVSNHTRDTVACATEETDWVMVPASHPACASVTNAEVEWVP